MVFLFNFYIGHLFPFHILSSSFQGINSRTHDCDTINKFKLTRAKKKSPYVAEGMPAWISQNRAWNPKKLRGLTKYNSAYGIPILGKKDITDESMRRMCYLVR